MQIFRTPHKMLIVGALSLLSACTGETSDRAKASIPPELSENHDVATLAGGCFWCMESPFEKLDGVAAVISGYSGGEEVDPSYEDVAHGRTGHTEAVQVFFDPEVISYQTILDVYWRQIDPTDLNGQFADRGPQYRPEIFVHSPAQRQVAKQSKKELNQSNRFDQPIVVPITDFESFYPAEEYHQDFYRKNPRHYQAYRRGSGREQFLENRWQD